MWSSAVSCCVKSQYTFRSTVIWKKMCSVIQQHAVAHCFSVFWEWSGFCEKCEGLCNCWSFITKKIWSKFSVILESVGAKPATIVQSLFILSSYISECDEDLSPTSLQPFLCVNKAYPFAITYLLSDFFGQLQQTSINMFKFFLQLALMGVQFFFVRKFTCFMKTLLITDHTIFDLLLVNYSCLSWNSLWIFTYIVNKSIIWPSTHIHSRNIAWLLYHGWVIMSEFVLV